MTLKQWPEKLHETVLFDDVVPPAVSVIRQGYTLKRNKDAKLTYNGYTLSKAALATSPDPVEALTKDSLDYHAERGRDLLDVVAGILFNLGIEQGQRHAQEAIQWRIDDAERAVPFARDKGWVEGVEAVFAAMGNPTRLKALRAKLAAAKDSIDFIENPRPLNDKEKARLRDLLRKKLGKP